MDQRSSRENLSSGFPNRFDTDWAKQAQETSRGLKFWIKEADGVSYLCSENKGADQLRGYHTFDLHLCFRISKKQVFSLGGFVLVYGQLTKGNVN